MFYLFSLLYKFRMKVLILKFSALFLIFLNTLHICYSAPIENQASNLTVLTEDVKWFLRGVSKISGTLEKMLPNVTVYDVNTRSFSENTKVTFLMGLRHLLVGIQEISMTFEENFNTDHIKHLHQLKNVTTFVGDILSVIKMWFSKIRALVSHLVHLYNRYLPEVLFGKCVGNYLMITYPDRSYYEYPLIFLSEIYSTIASKISDSTAMEMTTKVNISDSDTNLTQNEIFHSDSDEYHTSSLQLKGNSNTESFFDFDLVLNENKDKIIENAATQQSWQLCLKMYTAESISRSLKSYFLSL